MEIPGVFNENVLSVVRVDNFMSDIITLRNSIQELY